MFTLMFTQSTNVCYNIILHQFTFIIIFGLQTDSQERISDAAAKSNKIFKSAQRSP